MRMKVERITFPLAAPFAITGHVFNDIETVRVSLESDGVAGRGEGVGVYYLNDTADVMFSQLMNIQAEVEKGINFNTIQEMLPAGGARNALDCAFWDLEAKRGSVSVWDKLDIDPKPLKTVCTIGIGSKEKMADTARTYQSYPNLKIKLDGEDPIGKLEAIRAVRPDASLVIDVNQGWSFEELKEYAPHCRRLGLEMIEQPLPRGGDDLLEGYESPVPLGADESCLDASEYEAAAKRYDVINIKLDKCGGLTSGLLIANMALRDQKALMVGNMTGSSLSMAPAYVIGQFCHFVDIDGPLLLAKDIENGLHYTAGGIVEVPSRMFWG